MKMSTGFFRAPHMLFSIRQYIFRFQKKKLNFFTVYATVSFSSKTPWSYPKRSSGCDVYTTLSPSSESQTNMSLLNLHPAELIQMYNI